MLSKQASDTRAMNICAMMGGNAHTVVAAGVVNGDVNVGTDKQLDILKDKTLNDIGTWTREMIRVSAVDKVVEKLESGQRWVTITGNAGEGKTTLGYMVLKTLQENGHEVFKIDTPKDYTRVVTKTKSAVIMLNDVFGPFTFDLSQLGKWRNVIHDFMNDHAKSQDKKDDRTRVLFISRWNVLLGAKGHLGAYTDTLLDQCCVVDLKKMERMDDRLNILEYHLRKNDVSIPKDMQRVVAEMDIPHGFPHCCRIYARLTKKKETDIKKFFQSPLQFLDTTTEVLYLDPDPKYKFLFDQMIMYDGMLDVTNYDDRQERNDVQTAVDELINFYVKECSGRVTFAHPSIYESVGNVVGKKDPVFIVQHASLSFIMQKVNITKEDKDMSGFISVPPLPRIVNTCLARFQKQILEKDFSVFTNSRLCDSLEFCHGLVVCSTRGSMISLQTITKRRKLYINKTDSKGQTMLHVAVESENLTAVQVLLECGADVNKMSKHWYERSRAALHIACGKDLRGNLHEHVSLLIKHGADTRKVDSDGRTPLHYLCYSGHPDIRVIWLLIKHGADVNTADGDGRTPLHCVCYRGCSNVCVIELLIKSGAAVSAADCGGLSALHYVCDRDHPHVSVMELLIKHGVDVDNTDHRGRTGLHYLFSNGQQDVSVVKLLIKHGADVNKTDCDGLTPLHYLCVRDNPDPSVQEMMIEYGADVNAADCCGRTALHHVCCYMDHPDVTVMQLLIKHGADVNAANCDGCTALHYLCSKENLNVRVMELLIKHGGEVNKADRHGWTTLHYLCVRDDPCISVVKLLIKHGVDVNKTDGYGWTALHHLCKREYPSVSIIELLIKHGADVNAAGPCSNTALHCLCDNDQPNAGAVKLLIQEGADVNRADNDGQTALHFLCSRPKPAETAILLLVTNGIGVNDVDKNGNTGLRLLCKTDQPDINVIELLIKHSQGKTKKSDLKQLRDKIAYKTAKHIVKNYCDDQN